MLPYFSDRSEWNFPILIPVTGEGELHEELEVFRDKNPIMAPCLNMWEKGVHDTRGYSVAHLGAVDGMIISSYRNWAGRLPRFQRRRLHNSIPGASRKVAIKRPLPPLAKARTINGRAFQGDDKLGLL